MLLTCSCSCFIDLHSSAGSYGNLLLKAIRLSVDINDVLIPDPSLMPFLSGLCHQYKDEFFLVCFVTYLNFPITTSNRIFSPRKTFSLCFISQILVESGFEDKEWASPPALLSSRAAHDKQRKEPLAGTAAAEDSGLLNPSAHPFLIPNTHTNFVLLFLGLSLQIHTLLTTDLS